ncbi:MAG: YihY/virulence factor BrkB family protein [Chloroflexi bacterium]|jgi:membrane protein|nr:YihY/virulence factor BrkB family protein [Anaerolineaceae bacterium]NMB88944.1 YihY/virulence factor BrkB family protein [Chloroflexota bacterium]
MDIYHRDTSERKPHRTRNLPWKSIFLLKRDEFGAVVRDNWRRFLKEAGRQYNQINRWSGGNLDIVRNTILSFSEARAPEAAASIAYYALFSLFPLILAFITIASFFLKGDEIRQTVLEFVTRALPISQDFVISNINSILKERGTFSIVALVSLIWSATGVFNTLALNVERAWSDRGIHSILQRRLVALTMVGLLALLLVLSVFSTTLIHLLPEVWIPMVGNVAITESTFWKLTTMLLAPLFRFVMLFALYWGIPRDNVRRSAAFWSALFAMVAIELITYFFTWYLRSGLVRYELVYGSLGAIIALMLWIYLGSWILLFGAHLSATITRYIDQRNSGQ